MATPRDGNSLLKPSILDRDAAQLVACVLIMLGSLGSIPSTEEIWEKS